MTTCLRLLLPVLLLVGCASTPDSLPAPPSAPPTGDYRIQAGDEIDVLFPLSRELNVLTVVRPDGRISLKLVGEILAEGRTPAELTRDLQEAYASELRDPEIAVVVRGMAATIFVDGHIDRPGEYPWNPQITALQAIARAGGYRKTADEDELVVVRRSAEGPQILHIDREDENSQRDIFLAPYDVVVVPASGVADVNQWVDQYIRQNIPFTPRDISPTF